MRMWTSKGDVAAMSLCFHGFPSVCVCERESKCECERDHVGILSNGLCASSVAHGQDVSMATSGSILAVSW